MDALKDWIGSLRFEFVKYAKPVGLFSLVAVLISWVLVLGDVLGLGLGIGPKWGIDFTGGTEVVLRFDDTIDIGDLRATLDDVGIPSDSVTEVSASGGTQPEFKVRIQDPAFGRAEAEADVRGRIESALGADYIESLDFNAEVGTRFLLTYKAPAEAAPGTSGGAAALAQAASVREALSGVDGVKVDVGREERQLVVKLPGLASQVKLILAKAMGDRSFEVLSVDSVGPKVGASLRTQGLISIFATLGLILVYVAFRFDLAYAPGAVLALIHDVSFTAGLFVLLGKEFNLTLIGALLTILGYSLNDTIVIYDRIRENRTRYSRSDLTELVNQSINETLTRTIATAGTTFVATMAFLVLGTDVIADFVFAISLGVILGTYSTIYVATPMILVTERWKSWLASLISLPEAAEADEYEGIPEQFISDSEKRREERDRLMGLNAEPGGETP